MNLPLLLILLSLCGYITPVIAQSSTETTAPLFFEKAYLHTDRDVYGQGEDIWYKAYVVNAQNNEAINYSHNLYVELISPDAKIVSREMIRLENGLGNGDFKLSDSIPAGHYRLRAYTNWMRNFGDNFVFEKNITVLKTSADPPVIVVTKNNKKGKEKDKLATATATLNTASASTLPVVRFFPEGGDLVNGLSSMVGIKAEDEAGNGVIASGRIVDNAGMVVTAFSCDSLGFGSMALLPLSGQHYQALVMIHGKEQRFILPDVRSTGFGLQLHYLGADTVKAVISTADLKESSKHLYLVARHRGKSYVRQAVVLNGSRMVVAIPYPLLPEGISEITLYDEQNQPQCERLVYIHHPDQLKLSLSTTQAVYAPKGEVQVKLKLNSKEKASLSLAAVAADIPVPEENILSYLNLQSEVRGTIEHPGRYFDTTNVNRERQLDELLLTQGWRGFVWKKIADTALNISYQPEQGINITGKVRRILTNKPLPGISVTMRAPKAEGQKLFWATTDNAGRFSIYDTKFYGYQYINFTSRKSGKINRDGESKGSSGGYIQVDSLLRDTLPVHPAPLALQADTSWRANLQADAEIERIRKSLKLKADYNLKEVTIKAHTSRLYTTLPPEIHSITLVEQKEYDNLEQYLLYMVEGAEPGLYKCTGCMVDSTSPIVPILRQKGMGPIYIHATYADKSPIFGCPCQNEYLDLPMSNVLKVTINRIEDVFGKHISVNVVLRPGILDVKSYFDNTVADMTGYYKAREFYKPNAEKPNDIDLRTNTIHWEPNVISDDNGEATVTFYNTEQTGKIRLIAEGISQNGTPLISATDYEVK